MLLAGCYNEVSSIVSIDLPGSSFIVKLCSKCRVSMELNRRACLDRLFAVARLLCGVPHYLNLQSFLILRRASAIIRNGGSAEERRNHHVLSTLESYKLLCEIRNPWVSMPIWYRYEEREACDSSMHMQTVATNS
jgi:hypothetical protein